MHGCHCFAVIGLTGQSAPRQLKNRRGWSHFDLVEPGQLLALARFLRGNGIHVA
jgi:hypothetical protein